MPESLTTAEAAARLGVKPETVYAYVSRGLLAREPGSSRRGSRFSAAEVERLAARRRAGRPPRGVVESLSTRLTLIEDDELYYLGHRVRDLAGAYRIESVAELLWGGELDEAFAPAVPAVPSGVAAQARAVVAAMPPDARLTDRLRVAVAALAAADPWRYDLSPEAVRRTAASLLRGMCEALAAESPDPPESSEPPDPPEPLAAVLWPVLSDRPPALGVLDAALVLLADHGLAVSTVTARVAASTRAHPYAVLSAGLGALDGPLHGTASTAAYRFLGDALVDPVGAVGERLRAGDRLPGFGHVVYQRRDPRAEALLGYVRDTEVGRLVAELAERLADRPGMFPNVDLALAALVHAHGMRPDAAEAIFAVARTVGWVAHALEEYAEPGLRFRFTGSYTGPRPA